MVQLGFERQPARYAAKQPFQERIGGILRHRLVFNYLWELPFGRGKHWGSSIHGVADAVLGGEGLRWPVSNWKRFTVCESGGSCAGRPDWVVWSGPRRSGSTTRAGRRASSFWSS